jgi:two-component system, sensor histidine kinase PhcS
MNILGMRGNPAYELDLYENLLFYSRITCVITIILTLGGVGLDRAFYPAHASKFGWVRIGASILIGLVLLSYRLPWGRRNLRPLTYLWLCIPQAMISWMIYSTDGEQSIYFVGLTFALSGVAFFLPLSVAEALAFGGTTLVGYALGCALRTGGIQNVNTWAGNSLFILFYTIICVVIAIYSDKWRWLSFQLKTEVTKKNAELTDINRALAEVKGQLVQREKMAALGTLSAGLLHEVNNPVNYSLMAIDMALMDPATAQSADLKESLTDAREGMQRIQSIVSDLKIFAYQKPGEEDSRRVFLLEKAVQSALRLTSFDLKNVAVDLALPQDTHVLGDEPAIIGVLINLLSNAALALVNSARAQPQISLRGEHRAGRLWLAVRDNGTGIAPENIGRVLEPFFTTRDVGAGLGLGLSVSYGIIQRHEGLLSVASEFGAWTEFSFDLATPQR